MKYNLKSYVKSILTRKINEKNANSRLDNLSRLMSNHPHSDTQSDTMIPRCKC